MDSNTELPAIERWWPELSIPAKHDLQNNLRGEVSERVLTEIETLLSCSIPRSNHRLSDAERAFIETQTEIVD